MVPNFIWLVFIFWFISSLRLLANWAYWWQIKEYRFDRMRLLLKAEDAVGELELTYLPLLLVAIVLYIVEPLSLADFLFMFLFLLISLKSINEVLSRTFRRPKLTLRLSLILFISFSLSLFLSLLLWWQFYIFRDFVFILAVGQLLLVLCLLVGVMVTSLPVAIVKRLLILKARSLVDKFSPIVVGITGSYGKTTAKEFTATILASKFKVVKMPANQNTSLAIAQNIIKLIKPTTQLVVVEMGAYKRGEISESCNVTPPKIGVITGITGQHLALFGSMDNLIKAKYELISELPADGIAIFNAANKYCLKMAKLAKAQKIPKILLFKLTDNFKNLSGIDLAAKVIKQNLNSLLLELKTGNKKMKIELPFRGIHFVESYLASCLVAVSLGMTWNQILKASRSIKTPDWAMKLIRIGNNFIIDDSYSTNPEGFRAALKYLKLFSNYSKVVITSGIIELAAISGRVHSDLAKEMSIANKVFVTSEKAFFEFRSGLNFDRRFSLVKDIDIFEEELKDILSNGKTVILLEGRLPSILKELVLNNVKAN